ncbi:hypothetical protein HDU92_003838 [Lobulomyces angularis]|nr:hypothetical protein HDU92_003838 [Lobulomyces angularis]
MARSRSRSRSPARISRRRSRSRSRSRSPVKRSKSPSPSRIFINGISKNINDDHLKEIFGAYGEVSSVEIPFDKRTYVQFTNSKDASNAIEYMNGGQMDGTILKILIAQKKPVPRSPRSRDTRSGGYGGRSNYNSSSYPSRGRIDSKVDLGVDGGEVDLVPELHQVDLVDLLALEVVTVPEVVTVGHDQEVNQEVNHLEEVSHQGEKVAKRIKGRLEMDNPLLGGVQDLEIWIYRLSAGISVAVGLAAEVAPLALANQRKLKRKSEEQFKIIGAAVSQQGTQECTKYNRDTRESAQL